MPEFSPVPESMDKYNLHKLPEVGESADRFRDEAAGNFPPPEKEEYQKFVRNEDKIPETKDALVDAHFRRIERALENKRGMFTHLVKDKLLNEYTINLQNEDGSENTDRVDQLTQGLFESEKEILRRRGMGAELENYGDVPTSEDHEKYRQQIYSKKAEQEKTLGNWIDYLGDEEANFYPIWFKYLTLRSLQKMGKRDRDVEDYSKRSANTLQPFPDLSREALALTLDALKTQAEQGTTLDLTKQNEYSDEELQAQAEIDRMADHGNFAKLYAHFQGEIERAKREKGESTAGEWIHYPSGSDAKILCKTLEGKGTEWCTAGVDVARNQLSSGEFYIYYTYDKNLKPVDPRVAVFLINGQISEVRGVYGKYQDLELDFVDIAREKYKDFPGSEKYEKKDRDMKTLTAIERKTKDDQELTKDDLVFLYEINSNIEGFGHGTDPRVTEIRATRNSKEDAPIVLECQSEEIAWSQTEVNETTKAYVGPLFPGIFTALGHLEHIYTAFPEGKVSRGEFTTSGRTGLQLKNELENKKINKTRGGDFILESSEFVVSPAGEKISTIRLKVRDLFPDGDTHAYAQILAKASELGLDFLPHETASDLLLDDDGKNQSNLNEWLAVVTQKITGQRGGPDVFSLDRGGGGLWLGSSLARPDRRWYPGYEFMFRLRQVSQES